MFQDARQLTGTFGRIAGTNVEATHEGDEPSHAGVLGNASVWHSWTAPTSGTVRFDTLTRQTSFDTVLAVYAGDQPGALTAMASNDDISPFFFASRVTFRAQQGTTYHVAVDGVAGKSGRYGLHWAMRPGNDDFAAAQRIAGLSASAAEDNSLATREGGEPNRRTHTIWYSWTAPAGGAVVFETRGSDFDTVLMVYRGGRLADLRQLAINDDARGFGLASRVQLSVREGQTYRICVGSFSRFTTGRAQLNWHRPA